MTFLSYADLSQTAFPAAGDAVAMLPLAAVESHGPHLPLGTDGLIVEGILARAAAADGGRDRRVLRLPALWLGASAEHADRPGTLSVEPEALVGQIVAAAQGLALAGVRRVVLFNGHGGNAAAAAMAALRLRTRFGMLAVNVHWLDFGLPPGLAAPGPMAADIHGGWIETSAILHLAPHLVGGDAIASPPPRRPAPMLFPSGPIAWGWKTDDLAAGGWIGRPDLATPEIGKALVEHAAEQTVKLLEEVAAAAWPDAS
ncbi:creatininase family protein [Shumkonia mesophila]|uniref:creatininase family protein n=1 Tax=Shumkonia mesophila TaxID=2838854 RepID=UPI00293444D2|nr:creatininase family protein [Shumkonia mesophila]